MNYVELHIGDYEKATAHLTAVEDGVYGRLIRKYYDTEAPLPLDLKAVQRLVRARSKDEREAVETVLEEFFVEAADGWRHKRCDEEIARYQQKREKARKSAEARWSKDANASGTHANASADEDASAMRTHSDGNARQSPVTRHHQKHQASSRPVDPPQRASGLPPEVDGAAWDAFEDHHREKGRWSLSRQTLALGQLRVLITDGTDPNAVLTWATIRGLADLDDAARRMAMDAQRNTAAEEGQRPGESLADYSARLSRERLQRAATTTTPRLGHG